MATLINGNLNSPIFASQDADLLAAICGNQTIIAPVGNQFAHELEDANTIKVDDGVIITKEGRRIQLDAGDIDEFIIPTGTQGQTHYFLCGYHLYTDEESAELCETFVEPAESASETIDEDTFREGNTEVYVTLFRVTQVGVNITDIEDLLESGTTISQISNDLTDIRRNGTMPILDYAHPIHTFVSNNPKNGGTYGLTVTTTKECWLIGALPIVDGISDSNTISIDGIPVAQEQKINSNSGYLGAGKSDYVQLKVGSGSVVTVTKASNTLHLFDVISE